jgi:hypothetical protein
MRFGNVFKIILLLQPDLAVAETMICETAPVTVTGQSQEHLSMACQAVLVAQELFSQCNMPALPKSLRVDILQDLQPGCVGLFHCGEAQIDVLPPKLMSERRGKENAFAFLSETEFFRSVIVHELAHAAFEDVPCILESCRATTEYIAYNMQVMSLDDHLRQIYSDNSKRDRPILKDEINVMVLSIAPNVFAQKAWEHLTEKDEPCNFVKRIAAGDVTFDRDMR